MSLSTKEQQEKIDKFDQKIKQLQIQKQQYLKKFKEQERKERTRLLIQIGAIFNSVGIDTIEKAELIKTELLHNKEYNKTTMNLIKDLQKK